MLSTVVKVVTETSWGHCQVKCLQRRIQWLPSTFGRGVRRGVLCVSLELHTLVFSLCFWVVYFAVGWCLLLEGVSFLGGIFLGGECVGVEVV